MGSRPVSPAPRGLPHPEPLLGLVLALQAQHDHVGVHRRDLQLVFLLPHLLLLVHNAAAQQVHVQLRAVVLGGFVALEAKRRGTASPGVPSLARVCGRRGCWAWQDPRRAGLRPRGRRPDAQPQNSATPGLGIRQAGRLPLLQAPFSLAPGSACLSCSNLTAGLGWSLKYVSHIQGGTRLSHFSISAFLAQLPQQGVHRGKRLSLSSG